MDEKNDILVREDIDPDGASSGRWMCVQSSTRRTALQSVHGPVKKCALL